MTHTDDLALLHAYANGDEDAFALLIARHGVWIFTAARRRLIDDHLADDARQTVFLLLAEKANDLLRSNGKSLSAWLFHVMHFTCLNIRRTRIRQAKREAAVIRHRQLIADLGVPANQFFYDGSLMNFTVTSPDGYTIGFFSTYQPHTFDPALDG